MLSNAIEKIVNELEFDKSKIRSIVSDEGSYFLRLFKQYVNENEHMNLFIELAEPTEDSEDELDDDENHDSVSLSHFDFSYSEVLEYFDSHPRNIKKSLQDIVQNISMDPYLSSTRSFQGDFSFIHNIFNRFS